MRRGPVPEGRSGRQRLSGLHDHADGDAVLPVGRDEPAHQLDELRGEQRVERSLLDAVRHPLADPDIGESGSLELRGEGTLRQGTRHSPGPGGITRHDLRREIVLDGEI
jgi:hypothetical protein